MPNAINDAIELIAAGEADLELAQNLPEIKDQGTLDTIEKVLNLLLQEIIIRSYRHRIKTILEETNILIHLDNDGQIDEAERKSLNADLEAIYQGGMSWNEGYSSNRMAAQKLKDIGGKLQIVRINDETIYRVRTTVSIPAPTGSE